MYYSNCCNSIGYTLLPSSPRQIASKTITFLLFKENDFLLAFLNYFVENFNF